MLRSSSFLALFLLATPTASQTKLVALGDNVPGVGNVTALLAADINRHGGWVVHVDTDHPDITQDEVLLGPAGVRLREGQILTPSGDVLTGIESVQLDDHGQLGLRIDLNAEEALFYGNQIVRKTGDSVQGPAGGIQMYDQFISVDFNENRTLVALVVVQISTGSQRGWVVEVRFDADGNFLSQEARLTLPEILSDGTRIMSMRADHDIYGTSHGDFSFTASTEYNDTVVVFNHDAAAMVGTPSPFMRNWMVLHSSLILSDSGETLMGAQLGGGGRDHMSNEILVRNGDDPFVRESDVFADVSPAEIAWIGHAPRIADSGDVLWFGQLRPATPFDDGALFLNDELLFREGTSQIGGVEVRQLYRSDTLQMSSEGRFLLFQARLADGTRAIYAMDRGPQAHQVLLVGNDVNPRCLSSRTPPEIGSTWIGAVDTTILPNIAYAALIGHEQIMANPFPTLFGELIVSLNSPQVFGLLAAGSPTAEFRIAIPNDPMFLGRTVYAQAILYEGGMFSAHFCNAIHPTIGF